MDRMSITEHLQFSASYSGPKSVIDIHGIQGLWDDNPRKQAMALSSLSLAPRQQIS